MLLKMKIICIWRWLKLIPILKVNKLHKWRWLKMAGGVASGLGSDALANLSLVWLSLELTMVKSIMRGGRQFISIFWAINFLSNNWIYRDGSQLPQFVQMLIFERPRVQGKHTFNSAWDITIRLITTLRNSIKYT